MRVRSKYILHYIYTVVRSTFSSKSIPIHGPYNKSELNFSHSRSHFSCLPQAVSKVLINVLSPNFTYAYIMIDPVNNLFCLNKVRIYFQICDLSMFYFWKICLCLRFSNTSNVDSLDRFRKLVVDKVKLDLIIWMKQKHSKEYEMKIKYANIFIQNMELGDRTTYFYQIVFDKITVMTERLYNILSCMDLYYASS